MGNYVPSENEEYMNERHIRYFKTKLMKWRRLLITSSQNTMEELKKKFINESDISDRAFIEIDTGLELRRRDRDRKLLDKINDALYKIEIGEYGYCEKTGNPIGIERLKARPIASFSIEAQKAHENYEKNHMDQDDLPDVTKN